MAELSFAHGSALGDWWCDVRDEHGTYDFEDAVRSFVQAEVHGQEWAQADQTWAPNEVREWLDVLFGADETAFFNDFLNGYTEETGADEGQLVTGNAWRSLRGMGRAEGMKALHDFFGGCR